MGSSFATSRSAFFFFPSDGNLSNLVHPFYLPEVAPLQRLADDGSRKIFLRFGTVVVAYKRAKKLIGSPGERAHVFRPVIP